jgi:excinuclease ABC subunit A
VKESLTGQFLAGTRTIEIPAKRRKPSGYIRIEGASQHNLQKIDVKIPLGVLSSVTGVSGSGKSTLVNEVLLKAVSNHLHRSRQRAGVHKRISGMDQLDKIISVDQSPIGRTPRSNPATYIGLFDQIRDLFSKTQEARARGYKPGRFSFNVKGGRCEVCRGDGQIKIEMHFLPDVYVPCEQCHGKRYNRETLEVRFKGRTIADVLEMPIEEALEFFAHIPKIRRRVQALVDVGLGYMRLGQPATTLSGGEAQRVKLAAELSKVATGRTMYILDEPTTGLHFADIQRLLEVLQTLVDAGNSVVVIEHNLDVIKVSDWLIDLGPEGGDEGGRVIAVGTPEEVASEPGSYTGHFLAGMLPVKATRTGRAPARAGGRAAASTGAEAAARTGAKTAARAGAKTAARGERGAPQPAARSGAKATGRNGSGGAAAATSKAKPKPAANGSSATNGGKPRRRAAATR